MYTTLSDEDGKVYHRLCETPHIEFPSLNDRPHQYLENYKTDL